MRRPSKDARACSPTTPAAIMPKGSASRYHPPASRLASSRSVKSYTDQGDLPGKRMRASVVLTRVSSCTTTRTPSALSATSSSHQVAPASNPADAAARVFSGAIDRFPRCATTIGRLVLFMLPPSRIHPPAAACGGVPDPGLRPRTHASRGYMRPRRGFRLNRRSGARARHP